MKKYFLFFLMVVLLSCSDVREEPRDISELSHEQKISQVQKLFMPDKNEVSSPWIEHTKSETWILHTKWWESISWTIQKPIENTSQKDPTYWKDGVLKIKSASGKEIFTPEEIDLIESATDAEIDKLIDIIFKE